MSDRLVIGIDEAGRGPLIGCMFQACVVLKESVLEVLRRAGVRDSKNLSRKQREKLFGTILGAAEAVIVKSYPPPMIDRENINILLARGVLELVETATNIVGSGRLARVYIDEVSGRNARLILGGLNVPFVMEAGADRRYVAVSAASIVAKYFRDLHVDRLQRSWGDLGSGYPSDPKTRRWILKYYRKFGSLPPIVRSSWKTLAKLGIPSGGGGTGLDKWIGKSR